MAMEHVGMCTRITCKPEITATVTEQVWRDRVKARGWFLKRKASNLNSEGQGLLLMQFLADGNTKIFGRLEGCSGSGSNFVIAVETRGTDAFGQGGGTGALVAADYGKALEGDADGKLEISATAGAFGSVTVVGGDKAKLRVAWDTMLNI